MKKIMLGTSDTWLMSRLSHRPSNPAYYIEDCRISSAKKLNSSSNMMKVKLTKSLFSGCTFIFLLILICLHTYNHKNSASYSPNYYNHDHHSGKDYFIDGRNTQFCQKTRTIILNPINHIMRRAKKKI